MVIPPLLRPAADPHGSAVAGSGKQEFIQWIEANGTNTTGLVELPLSLLQQMFPDVTPKGSKWDSIAELTRRIKLNGDSTRRRRMKNIGRSDNWITGIPNDPQVNIIYQKMFNELTQHSYSIGYRNASGTYARICLLYLVEDWVEFMHPEKIQEGANVFRKLASSYRVKLN